MNSSGVLIEFRHKKIASIFERREHLKVKKRFIMVMECSTSNIPHQKSKSHPKRRIWITFITTESRSLVAVCTYDVQNVSDILPWVPNSHLQKYMKSHGHAKSISSMTTANHVTSIADSDSCDVQAQFLLVKF